VVLKEGESLQQNLLAEEEGELLVEKDHLGQILDLRLENLLKELKLPTSLRL
jgi:hypothetical protein